MVPAVPQHVSQPWQGFAWQIKSQIIRPIRHIRQRSDRLDLNLGRETGQIQITD
jgi:hypothetical protein